MLTIKMKNMKNKENANGEKEENFFSSKFLKQPLLRVNIYSVSAEKLIFFQSNTQIFVPYGDIYACSLYLENERVLIFYSHSSAAHKYFSTAKKTIVICPCISLYI